MAGPPTPRAAVPTAPRPRTSSDLARQTPRTLFAAPGTVHLIGALGSGMRALSDVLSAGGWRVTGADLSADPDWPNVFLGHRPENIPADAELVVASSAVPPDNCELLAARRRNLDVVRYSEMLGRITAGSQTLAIAGTHGKSTIAAMLGEILLVAGLDPTIVIGAAPVAASPLAGEYLHGGRRGRDPIAVVEACEYRGNFLHLAPQMAVISNIEPDHFDCYPRKEDLHTAFADFARRLPGGGTLWIQGDDPTVARLALAPSPSGREHGEGDAAHGASSFSTHIPTKAPALVQPPSQREREGSAETVVREVGPFVRTFGYGPESDIRAAELESHSGCYQFRLIENHRLLATVRLAVLGRHQVQNALAAAAVARTLGISGDAIGCGLTGFRGLIRRLEERRPIRDVRLVDDYAHHPTQVAAALTALREAAGAGRIWCVFQPHQVSRTRRLLDPFAVSLQNADKVVVAPVFRAREPDAAMGEVEWGHVLADRIGRLGGDAQHLAGLQQIEDALAVAIARGELTRRDMLVTMGAGDVGKIVHGLRQRFREIRAAG